VTSRRRDSTLCAAGHLLREIGRPPAGGQDDVAAAEDLDRSETHSVSVRVSPQERELLEAAAEQSRTNLSDFIRRKAVEAAKIELFHQGRVAIQAIDWEKLEAWMDSPPKDVSGLADLARARPAWRD